MGGVTARGGDVLAYWLDAECLVPAEVPFDARGGRFARVARSDATIRWPGGLPDGARSEPKGTGFLVRIGLFDLAAAYARVEALLGADGADPAREPGAARRGGLGFLADFRTGPDGRVVPDSFRASLFALRFAALPHASPTPDELDARRTRLAESFAETAQAGTVLDMQALARIDDWLRGHLRQRPSLAEDPRRPFAHVTRLGEDEEEEGPLTGSFVHADLSLVARARRRGETGEALERYLDPRDLADEARLDLDDPTTAADLLVPHLFPRAKWPSRGSGGPATVLRQQMAVNAACATRAGLVAVNGPPGTGKSTLLRDVIAEAIARRALALTAFRDPREAFSRPADERPGWELHPSLRGHGILVCSGNNKAVENVSHELPALDAIAPDWLADPGFRAQIDAFAGVAERVGGEPAWGLISGALGNRANRRRFAEAFWPNRDGSARIILEFPRLLARRGAGTAVNGNVWLDVTLADASGTYEARAWAEDAGRLAEARLGGDVAVARQAVLTPWDRSGAGHMGSRAGRRLNLKALSDEPPETGIRQALEAPGALSWTVARARFLAAWEEAGRLVELTDTFAAGPAELRRLDTETGLRLAAAAKASAELAAASERAAAAAERLTAARHDFTVAGEAVLAVRARRPGLAARLFRRAAIAGWLGEVRAAKAGLAVAAATLERVSAASVAAENLRGRLGRDADMAASGLGRVRAARETAAALYRQAREAFAAPPVSPADLWQLPPEGRETGTAWTTPELDRAREAVFAAAMALHAAFLREARGPVLENLRLHLDLLTGDAEAVRTALRNGGAAWDTFFLAVPVVSSTFASLGPMFRGAIPAGGLGWVLVDEAGQARPQDPVGAIWRGRRVLMVGDPRQVEPVSRLPRGVSAFLARHHGVANPAFDSAASSGQALADRGARLGAWLGTGAERTWVGCPLRVHRRCDEPMFGISNALSYGGSMVLGKPVPDYAAWEGAFPDWGPGGRESAWIDIRGTGGPGKEAPAAAAMALRILRRMVAQRALAESLRLPDGRPAPPLHLTPDGLPDAYVISPFSDVAQAFRRQVGGAHEAFASAVPGLSREALRAWTDARVGTIHAFQGGQAQTVILLLGGHAGTAGAIRWACARPNLLNVAVTRARSSLYVIGDRELWMQGAFAAAGVLPVAETPAYVATAPDPREVERLGTLEAHLGALGRALSEARERVVICSPFLRERAVTHPALPVLDLVGAAARRGVEVRVYVDGRFHAESPDAASSRAAEAALRRAGAEVRLVGGLHAKTLCVDRDWIVDGSFNWLSSPREGALRRHEASYLYRGREAGRHVDEALAAVEALEPWAPA